MSSTVDSNTAFGAMVRHQLAAYASGHQQRRDSVTAHERQIPMPRGAVAAFSIFVALAIMSLVIFTIGYAALMSDAPAIWIHRLMALTVAQSILIAAVAMKLMPLIERDRLSVRIVKNVSAERARLIDQSAATPEPAPVAAPAPRKPVAGGKLAGRDFLEYHDGTIEIDTLVGRRRFVSIDAAREFVGL